MEDYLKELYFVDYCNQCKDLDVMSHNNVHCHHPWYCHLDKGEVQDLEASIGRINYQEWLRGYLFATEKKELHELKEKKFHLVKQKLREFRRQK